MQKMQQAKAVRSTKRAYPVGKMKINMRGKASSWLIVVLSCLIVGILVGGLSLYVLTKNDCFEMVATVNGEIDWEIGSESTNNTYQELGVKCIAFGQDVSDSISVKYLYREDIYHDVREVSGINPDNVGFYYVVYTSTNLKYRMVQLIRNVIVVGEEE